MKLSDLEDEARILRTTPVATSVLDSMPNRLPSSPMKMRVSALPARTRAGTARGDEQPPLDAPAQTAKRAQEELLERKLAELAVLQDEIRDLRRATGRQIEIVLQVQVVELSRTKMRARGLILKAPCPPRERIAKRSRGSCRCWCENRPSKF
jgi:hypothetical protein